jgi:hypothetical protein
MALDFSLEFCSRGASTRTVLIECAHGDPVQVTCEVTLGRTRIRPTGARGYSRGFAKVAHSRAGARRLLLADDPLNLAESGATQHLAIKGRRSCGQPVN